MKKKSEELKWDFSDLLNTVSFLNAQVFISGPLTLVSRGVERFSRFLAMSTWLSIASTIYSVHFLHNSNFFRDCRHIFEADGLCCNKSGVKLFIYNLFIFFYFLSHPSAPTARDKRQEVSKQVEDITQHGRNLEKEAPQPPPEERALNMTVIQAKRKSFHLPHQQPPVMIHLLYHPKPNPSHPPLQSPCFPPPHSGVYWQDERRGHRWDQTYTPPYSHFHFPKTPSVCTSIAFKSSASFDTIITVRMPHPPP